MPQLVAVIIAGAGLYAGLRWLSKALERHALAARRAAEDELARRERGAGRPVKDLGTLEYDPESRIYRPRPRG
jgi:hypothetical protein